MTDLHSALARASEVIAAAPEDVFEALLDPEALAEWFILPDGGRTRDWEVEPVPGGAWRARTVAPDGSEGEMRGDVLAVDAPHLLELRWHRSSQGDVGSTVRFDLEPIWRLGERATRLTVTHVADQPLAARVMMGVTAGRHELCRLPSLPAVPSLLLRSLVCYFVAHLAPHSAPHFASATVGRR